jgi:hypothetical protein
MGHPVQLYTKALSHVVCPERDSSVRVPCSLLKFTPLTMQAVVFLVAACSMLLPQKLTLAQEVRKFPVFLCNPSPQKLTSGLHPEPVGSILVLLRFKSVPHHHHLHLRLQAVSSGFPITVYSFLISLCMLHVMSISACFQETFLF